MLDKLIVKMLTWLNEDHGQDMVEYVIITGGVALALVGALAVLSPTVGNWFGALKNVIANSMP